MWIIEDWMGNRVFPTQSFNSFTEARDRISEHAGLTARSEEEYDGICEDLYAEREI